MQPAAARAMARPAAAGFDPFLLSPRRHSGAPARVMALAAAAALALAAVAWEPPRPSNLPSPRSQHHFVAPPRPANGSSPGWRPVEVTSFGAVGDGVHNDRPAIQAAIDAALADGSRAVYFPPGDYRTDGTLLASGSKDLPTGHPVSLRGYATASNTRIMMRLPRPVAPPPALPTAVIKFQGASMAAALPCRTFDGHFCAGAGVFSHTVVENLAIDVNVTGDPLGNNTAGIEFAAVIGAIVSKCDIGILSGEVGILMHNNANGSFTEFCQAHDTVFGGLTAVQYRISTTSSHVSFHGSGLVRAAVQGSRNPMNPVIRVGPYPRWVAVYNAPLDFQFWQQTTVPMILVEPPLNSSANASAAGHQGPTGPTGAIVQTHGTITIEGNPPVLAGGAPVYHAGSYMCWCDADAVEMGTFYQVQSIGTDWAGGGGEGSFGVNAVLAPINSKQLIMPGRTIIPHAFSALGDRPSYAQVPVFMLQVEIGASTAPTQLVGSGFDGAGGGTDYRLLRTFLVECSGDNLGGCALSEVGKGMQSHTAQYGVPTFAAAPSGDVLVDAPTADSQAAGGWPTAGVMAAVTMTPLSQGPSAHDQREALQLKTDDAKAGQLPVMGFSSWCQAGCGDLWEGSPFNATSAALRRTADRLVSSGLRDAGYTYVLLDDGWPACAKVTSEGECATPAPRLANGDVLVDLEKFPPSKDGANDGLKLVADYLHQHQLKFGIYSAPGPTTCGGFEGIMGHEEHDVKWFAAQGIEFLKLDYGCGDVATCRLNHTGGHPSAIDSLRKVGASIAALEGQEMVLYIDAGNYNEAALWNPNMRGVVPSFRTEQRIARSMDELVYVFGPRIGANMWKIWSDRMDDFVCLMGEVHAHLVAGVKLFQRPGAITTLDAMTIGRAAVPQPGGLPPMTESEHRIEVFIYAVLSSPMVLSFDLSAVPPILLNREIIAIDRDPDVVSASLINGFALNPPNPWGTDLYIKPLADGSFAVALINKANFTQTMRVEMTSVLDFGPFTGGSDPGASRASVRDVYAQSELGSFSGSFNTTVGARDGRLLRFTFIVPPPPLPPPPSHPSWECGKELPCSLYLTGKLCVDKGGLIGVGRTGHSVDECFVWCEEDQACEFFSYAAEPGYCSRYKVCTPRDESDPRYMVYKMLNRSHASEHPDSDSSGLVGAHVWMKNDDAPETRPNLGCAVKAGHCFGGRKGYFLYDLCGMANRSWIVKDTTGWKEPYLVAPPGQLADTSSCVACSGKRARAFQLYPSSIGGNEVAFCNASHADRCYALGTSSDQAAAPDAALINESDPPSGVTIRWSGGYATLQLNLTCCPSCGLDNGPVAVRESADGSSYSFSWPTAAACPKWVSAADCGFPPLAKAQPAQMKWIENEIGALIHFNYQTSLGGDKGCGSYTPESFDPTAEGFTDQWATSMLDLGVKHAVLVAKHDCGFTLWPTAAKEPDGQPYNFSIVQSRYKGGKGDVVAEFVASMQRAGLEHGYYCSQGLKQNGYAREKKRWTTAQYSPVIRTLLTELWSEKKYTGTKGLLRELWMDGGVELTDQSWVKQAVAQWQPNASVFNGCCLFNGSLPPATDGSRDTEIAANCVTKNPISWIGTEAGHAPDDTWSSGLQWGPGSSSSPTASFRESDTVLQKTQWFFTGEDVRTLPDLIGSYETTAGHNSLFMIDFAPQPNGLLHPLHVATYKALGDWIRECYYIEEAGGRVANTSAAQMLWLQADTSSRPTGNILRLELSEPSFVNRIVLQEDLTRGQAVRAWEVEGQLANVSKAVGAPWVVLAAGQSIGNKHIAVLSHATALLALRLRVVRAAAEVVSIKNFAAHSCQVPMKNDDTAAHTMVQRVNTSSGASIPSHGHGSRRRARDQRCQRGTPIIFGSGNPGCASGACCAKGSTHDEARKCVNSTDCLGCGGCTFCFESHTFAGNWCDKPPPLYKCNGGTCSTAPHGAGGVDLETCQRVCLKDGYACQDHQCVPQTGGVNKSTCASICEPANSTSRSSPVSQFS